MRVCARLGIPFMTLDLEKEYKKEVADYMISEYRKGRTPNPDVMCNKYIKFGSFLSFAKEKGADYIATGHYAQVIESDVEFCAIVYSNNISFGVEHVPFCKVYIMTKKLLKVYMT